MTYGGPDTIRNTTKKKKWIPQIPLSIGGLIATVAESLGILNKGSAKQPAAPAPGEVGQPQPISSNTLNVTRVGGLAALISGAGGAALVLFNVNKTKDRASIVVAAYASVGVIVAAALLTAAIIIMADIRARTRVAVAVSPTPPSNAFRSVTAPKVNPPQDSVVSLDRAYDLVLADATAANLILTLPSAGSVPLQPITIRRQDQASNYVIVRPQDAEEISGKQQLPLDPAKPLQIYSDGQKWLTFQ